MVALSWIIQWYFQPRECEKDVVVEARGSVDDLVETASRASESLVVYSRGY